MPMNFDSAPPCMSGPPVGDSMDIVASHQRVLIAAALRTTGDILELGCGWYSTPLLHEIATVQNRQLWTFDNQEYWLPPFKKLTCPEHKIIRVGWWGDMYGYFPDRNHRFGLVFVDQGQPCEREYAIRNLIERADVFVMHDTEEKVAYGYERTLKMFKHQVTDKCQRAWTTVASNIIDVTKWGLRLMDSHEQATEIT